MIGARSVDQLEHAAYTNVVAASRIVYRKGCGDVNLLQRCTIYAVYCYVIGRNNCGHRILVSQWVTGITTLKARLALWAGGAATEGRAAGAESQVCCRYSKLNKFDVRTAKFNAKREFIQQLSLVDGYLTIQGASATWFFYKEVRN